MFKAENKKSIFKKNQNIKRCNEIYNKFNKKLFFQYISDDLDKLEQTSESLNQISYKLKQFGRKFNFPKL